VINIKVNVEAQAKRSAYPGSRGIHRQTVFCLLYSISCLLSFTQIPYPTTPLQLSSVLYKSPHSAQNKPNVKMGNINISTAIVKAYANKQRTMNNERCSKQTQSNPIPASRERPAIRNPALSGVEGTQYAIRSTQYAIRSTQYAVRNTQYAIRNTNLAQPPPGSHNMKKMCLGT